MPPRKKFLTTRRLGEQIRRFSRSEWELLDAAYGTPLSDKTKRDLKHALDAWSLFCGAMPAFRYGKDEARRMRKFSASAALLLELIESSSELEDLMIRGAMSETECDLNKFRRMLGEIALMEERASNIGEEECSPEDLQISMLADALRENGYPVRVAKKIKGVNFTPSPFVRFVSCLWELCPETRLYTPTGDHEANMSQWISERLRAEQS